MKISKCLFRGMADTSALVILVTSGQVSAQPLNKLSLLFTDNIPVVECLSSSLSSKQVSKYQCLIPQVESDVGCPVAAQLQRCLEARDDSERHFLPHIPLQELEGGLVHGAVRWPALYALEVQERYHDRLTTATHT